MLTEKVIEIIANELSVSKKDIEFNTNLKDDLGADSLNAVEVIMAIEEQFNLSIPDDDAQQLKTVGDIINYLESKVQK